MSSRPDKFTRDTARIAVTVRGVAYEGWLQSEVQRELESIAGTFSIPVALVPGQPPDIKRQDEVQIYIGQTLVLSGFVLAAEPFYRRGDCGVRVVGRDRTGDLVHCTAVHGGGQWRNATLERIAKDLLGPFKLGLVVDADIGPPITDFKLGHAETVKDALSRAARLRGVLVSGDNAGRVLLTKAGTRLFAGSIVRGLNVVEMQGLGSDEQRHSVYTAYGQRNAATDFESARGLKAQATDTEMLRYLPLVINADGNTTQDELQRLVDHTARVRRGHSLGYRYTVEGWTWQGQAWPVNERVAIYDDIAGLDGAEWLICSVRHTCDLREGDVTELEVRPIEAYDTVPLKSNPHHRNWGNKGNTTNHPSKGPSDRAGGA